MMLYFIVLKNLFYQIKQKINSLILIIKISKFNIFRFNNFLNDFNSPEIGAEVLDRIPKRSKVFEWGSGVSTLYLTLNRDCNLISIDSSRNWTRLINSKLQSINLTDSKVVNYINIGPTIHYGIPLKILRPIFKKTFSRYWSAARHFRNFDPNIVIVDGRFRLICSLEALQVFKSPFMFIIDDYIERASFRILEEFLGSPIIVNRAAIFNIHDEIPNDQLIKLKKLQTAIIKSGLVGDNL